MTVTLLKPTIIAKEALMQLRNNMVMGNLVHRQYKKEYVKIGETLTIRKPMKFVVTDGVTRTNQDVVESSTSIVINKRKHVSWSFLTADLTMTIEEYSERYITPAVVVLANQVDMDLCDLYKDVFLASGTAGTTPVTFGALGGVAQKMTEMAIPYDNRNLVLNPAGHWGMADGLKGIFQTSRVEDIIKGGVLNRVAGFNILEDQNIKTHTKGIATGTPVSNGANQVGASIITGGWTASQTGILKTGDVITFATVYAVNPISKASTGQLMQFVLTADANSDGAGASTIAIAPAVVATGAYQNVNTNGIPTAQAIVTLANHVANLAFHKNAFALVMCPLDLPDGAAWKAQEQHEGISIRVVKDYDIDADTDIIRLDIFYGVKTIYPDLAARLLG